MAVEATLSSLSKVHVYPSSQSLLCSEYLPSFSYAIATCKIITQLVTEEQKVRSKLAVCFLKEKGDNRSPRLIWASEPGSRTIELCCIVLA